MPTREMAMEEAGSTYTTVHPQRRKSQGGIDYIYVLGILGKVRSAHTTYRQLDLQKVRVNRRNRNSAAACNFLESATKELIQHRLPPTKRNQVGIALLHLRSTVTAAARPTQKKLLTRIPWLQWHCKGMCLCARLVSTT